MTAALVIANLMYLVGAVVVAALIGLFMALRHRRPQSVDDKVASFRRSLDALAPNRANTVHPRSMPSGGDVAGRSGPPASGDG